MRGLEASVGGGFLTHTPTKALEVIGTDFCSERPKVLIRPACKRFVQKQHLGTTLSCFKSSSSTTSKADPQPIHASPSPGPPVSPSPQRSSTGVNILSNKFRKIPLVMEGRIEKRRSPTLCASPTASESSVFSEELTNCPCISNNRGECQRCRILRLAEQFCNIVDTQCCKWNTPSTPQRRSSLTAL